MSDIPIALYEEVKDLPNHPEAYLFDVRDPPEIKETGLIPTSINIPRKHNCYSIILIGINLLYRLSVFYYTKYIIITELCENLCTCHTHINTGEFGKRTQSTYNLDYCYLVLI